MEGQREVSVRPVEGDTDLSWNHEGLEPHPKLGEPKPPRDSRPSRSPKTEIREKQTPVKACPKCRGAMMKGIVQNSYLKKKNMGLCLIN